MRDVITITQELGTAADYYEGEIKATEKATECTIDKQVMALLLGHQITMTEKVVMAAVGNGENGWKFITLPD
jgi:hypothetical protein